MLNSRIEEQIGSTGIFFTKMSGSGNDFIIIDNMNYTFPKNIDRAFFAKKVCRRGISVGADGVLFLEPSDLHTFKWDFYNSDGSIAEMCGNAIRCVVKFAYDNKISKGAISVDTLAGVINGEMKGDKTAFVEFTPYHDLQLSKAITVDGNQIVGDFVNTGVPHFVVNVDDLDNYPILELGKKIRLHSGFDSSNGTNVNFIQITEDNTVKVRTYERGVENETLACGTGFAAVGLTLIKKGILEAPIKILTASKENIIIHFIDDKLFFEGYVRTNYSGYLHSDALV